MSVKSLIAPHGAMEPSTTRISVPPNEAAKAAYPPGCKVLCFDKKGVRVGVVKNVLVSISLTGGTTFGTYYEVEIKGSAKFESGTLKGKEAKTLQTFSSSNLRFRPGCAATVSSDYFGSIFRFAGSAGKIEGTIIGSFEVPHSVGEEKRQYFYSVRVKINGMEEAVEAHGVPPEHITIKNEGDDSVLREITDGAINVEAFDFFSSMGKEESRPPPSPRPMPEDIPLQAYSFSQEGDGEDDGGNSNQYGSETSSTENMRSPNGFSRNNPIMRLPSVDTHTRQSRQHQRTPVHGRSRSRTPARSGSNRSMRSLSRPRSYKILPGADAMASHGSRAKDPSDRQPEPAALPSPSTPYEEDMFDDGNSRSSFNRNQENDFSQSEMQKNDNNNDPHIAKHLFNDESKSKAEHSVNSEYENEPQEYVEEARQEQDVYGHSDNNGHYEVERNEEPWDEETSGENLTPRSVLNSQSQIQEDEIPDEKEQQSSQDDDTEPEPFRDSHHNETEVVERNSPRSSPSTSPRASYGAGNSTPRWRNDDTEKAAVSSQQRYLTSGNVTKSFAEQESASKLPSPTIPAKLPIEGCYLTYLANSGGSMSIQFSKAVVNDAMGFWFPGPGKAIQSFKFKQNQGRSDLIKNVVGRDFKKKYFSGWCQFVKAARMFNGIVVKYPEKGGLEVDLYVFFNETCDIKKISDREPFDVSDISAVACIPAGNPTYDGVKKGEFNKFLNRGHAVGTALSIEGP